MGTKVWFGLMEKVLEMDSGESNPHKISDPSHHSDVRSLTFFATENPILSTFHIEVNTYRRKSYF